METFPPILEKGLYLQKKIFVSIYCFGCSLDILVLVSYMVEVIKQLCVEKQETKVMEKSSSKQKDKQGTVKCTLFRQSSAKNLNWYTSMSP